METILEATRSLKPEAAVSPSGAAIAARSLVGIVVACDGEHYTVLSGDVSATAKRAVSCLMDVARGDTVQWLMVAPDQAWITAVLQREEGVEDRLLLRGSTRVEIEEGELSLVADRIHMQGEALDIEAQRTRCTSGDTEVIGSDFRVFGGRFKLVGKLFHAVFDRINHYSKHYLRTTEGLDRVQSAQVEISARQLGRISGETVLVEGEKLVKTRGSQIHFG